MDQILALRAIDTSDESRNCLLFLLFQFMLDPEAHLVRSGSSVAAFCDLFFEANSQNMFLDMFENICVPVKTSEDFDRIEELVNYMLMVLKSSEAEELGIVNSISPIVKARPCFFGVFAFTLRDLIGQLCSTSSGQFIVKVLSFFHSNHKIPDLSDFELRYLFSVSIRRAGLTKEIRRAFLAGLADSEFFENPEQLIIINADPIPILLAVEIPIRIIGFFTKLAQFSIHDRHALHDGDLDLILLEGFAGPEFGYGAFDVNFHFSPRKWKSLIFPFISEIFSHKKFNISGRSHF
jgi:hypothetical protein